MAMSRVRHVCPRTSGTPQVCHSHHPHLAVSLWRARASTDRAGTWPSSHCTGCKSSGKEKANVCRCQVRRGHWAEQLMPGVLRTSLSACGKFACKGEQPERCPVLWAACSWRLSCQGSCTSPAPGFLGSARPWVTARWVGSGGLCCKVGAPIYLPGWSRVKNDVSETATATSAGTSPVGRLQVLQARASRPTAPHTRCSGTLLRPLKPCTNLCLTAVGTAAGHE